MSIVLNSRTPWQLDGGYELLLDSDVACGGKGERDLEDASEGDEDGEDLEVGGEDDEEGEAMEINSTIVLLSVIDQRIEEQAQQKFKTKRFRMVGFLSCNQGSALMSPLGNITVHGY